MVRTVLALQGELVRGALAHYLRTEAGIDVVGETDTPDGFWAAVRAERPDVAVLDVRILPTDELCRLTPDLASLRDDGARLLMLVEPRRAARLSPLIAEHGRHVGLLGRDVAPGRIADGVRDLAAGEVVLDPDLVVAALDGHDNPLTPREREVLDIVAEGHPVREIARKLALSAGTVRNHLSRIMAKTGARTRLDAVRIARESGWI
ncbi:DNA-binding response regulator [Micromonospora acroterricola]|uniref:DNA-binding response regulator n=1 Tax=Micromonospora acroterricola TaxID=2202421 RepID=A0A317D7C2_9ACTN|nr:response regulator transcription factor [Micromonospora acroterricola]PWR10771.1 DNA-binding response regulator [Micromonospora acroterricola]